MWLRGHGNRLWLSVLALLPRLDLSIEAGRPRLRLGQLAQGLVQVHEANLYFPLPGLQDNKNFRMNLFVASGWVYGVSADSAGNFQYTNNYFPCLRNHMIRRRFLR